MYIGTHYNSYYNSLYSANSKVAYGSAGSFKANNLLQNSGIFNNGKTSGSTTQYMQDLKTGSADLKNALSQLANGSAFRKTAMVSSDSEAMSVKMESKYATGIANKKVKIDQLAAGQVNSGAALDSTAKSVNAGTKEFEIEVNGKTTKLSVEVAATDTNKDVQQKMASAINGAGLGISASVSMSENNETTLTLTSGATGKGAKGFSIRDTNGDLVGKTGVGAMTKEAQDAVYTVDGKQYTSGSNEVSLGNGVKATLKKAGDAEITVSRGTDLDNAKAKVKDMVEGYNKLYSAALNNAETDSKAEKLFDQLLGASKTYMTSLANVGIGFDGDGKMTINSSKLNEAAEDGSLEQFFVDNSKGNYGFANKLNSIAGDVNRNPLNHVDKSNINSASLLSGSFYNSSSMVMKNYNFFNSGLSFDFLL